MILTHYFQVKLIKNLLGRKHLIQVLTVFWTVLVTYLCLASSESLPSVDVFRFDKLGHFAFHLGITTMWFLFWKTTYGNENKNALLKAFLFSFFFGIIIEISQAVFTETRHGDITDVFANSLGALTAVFIIYLMSKKDIVLKKLKSN